MIRLPLLLLLMLVPAMGEVRVWTNDAGKKITAELVEISGDDVVLSVKGHLYRVPISSLSEEDQTFIKNWKEKPKRGGGKKLEGNWNGKWPTLIDTNVDIPIKVIKEDDKADLYIYASPHYQFNCNVKLRTSVVRRFAILFEATHLYCRELPIGLVKPHKKKKLRIDLFETRQEYIALGGPPSSAGVYFSGKTPRGSDFIAVPLSSLGVRKIGKSYGVDHDRENSTLGHEITHQITDREYFKPGSRGWFSEGLAEYVSRSGYRSGKFKVQDLDAIKEAVTGHGWGLGTEIEMPRLEGWMKQSYGKFLSHAARNYGVATLVVYYFFHMDGNGDAANIKAFLRKLKEDASPTETQEALLNGRTYKELEDQISKAWRSRGIKITFK